MADSTLDSELFVLYDNWPGVPTPMGTLPTDGFTGSTHNNVETAVYPVGTKVQVYNTGTAGKAGHATLMYLQVGTQAADDVIAVKAICVPDSATDWYKVTDDPDDCINIEGGLCAIAISAMTDAYYGWFWVGGVCPEDFVSTLGGTYLTVDTQVAGAICLSNLTANAIGMDICNSLSAVAIGYAIA